jgi:serine/threonine-protein kinase MRCK
LTQQQARYNLELSSLREQLHEAESHRELLEREVQNLKEKQEKHRVEAISESEQMIAELNRRHDRDKQILLDDNHKLTSNVEFVSLNF